MNKNYEKINSESECNNLGKTCKKEPGIKEILLSKAVNSNNRLCVYKFIKFNIFMNPIKLYEIHIAHKLIMHINSKQILSYLA